MKLACSGDGSPLSVMALLQLSMKSSTESLFFLHLPLNFLRLCSFGTTINCLVALELDSICGVCFSCIVFNSLCACFCCSNSAIFACSVSTSVILAVAPIALRLVVVPCFDSQILTRNYSHYPTPGNRRRRTNVNFSI